MVFIVLLFLTRSRVGKLEKQNDRLWAELGRAKDRLRTLEGPDHVPEPEFVPPPVLAEIQRMGHYGAGGASSSDTTGS